LPIFTINLLKEQDYVHVFACHLPKASSVKLVRDPISVGIDPLRKLLSVVFCGVGNMIEMVSNMVLVRNANCQSSQSIF
jgi:hypothetical protein